MSGLPNANYGSNALLRRRFRALGHTLCVVCSRAELPPICLFISRGDATTRALGLFAPDRAEIRLCKQVLFPVGEEVSVSKSTLQMV